MPRLHPLQASFTAGELSPRLWGRVDLAKYATGAQRVENYLVLPTGGVTRRPGTRYVAETKYSDACARLLRFEFSVTQAYMLELGCEYLRFYKNGAQVTSGGGAVEVTTPYAAHDLGGVHIVQSGDVLYLLHDEYQPRKLERYSDSIWKLRTVTFIPPPTFENGDVPLGDLVPAAVSGNDITIEARNVDSFLAADVGRDILVTSGTNAGARAGIKSITGAKEVVANICVPFAALTATCSGGWTLTASPRTTATLSAAGTEGGTVTITAGANAFRSTTAGSDSHCGKYVLVNGGQYEIVSIASATGASATVRGVASSATAAQPGAWSIEESLWSATHGWPSTGTFFEDRLWLDARYRFVGSKTSDYENFGLGTADDDAVLFAINADQLNVIRALMGARQLQAFTAGGEFIATGGADNPITPTNVDVSNETTYGAASVQPIRVGDVTLFLTRSQRRVREYTVDPESAEVKYVAPDLLRLADHLTRDSSIVEMAYQRDPEPTLWCVRADGVLLSCAYNRQEGVVGWARHTFTNGTVESVGVVPHPDGDREQVWLLIRRTIGGATKRYVEYLDDDGLYYRQLNVDAAYTCDLGAGTTCTSFVGLGHLEGQGVQVVADGAVLPMVTVSSGNVMIAEAARRVEIGLCYASTLTTLKPEVPTGAGSSQSFKMRWTELFVRLFETLGMTLKTDLSCTSMITFRKTSDPLNQPPPLFSGDKRYTHLGWDCGTITVQQTQPLPSTVLMIGGTLDLGGA